MPERAAATPLDDDEFDVDLACPACNADLTGEPLFEKFRLCPNCRRHFWIAARDRIGLLVDPGSFNESTPDLLAIDRGLDPHLWPVADRLSGTRELPGIADAVVTGTAAIGGEALVLVALDLALMGGNAGIVAGEKIALAMELAATRRLPLLAICSGGNTSGPEGVLVLAQLGKLATGAARLHRAGVPFISLLTHPTAGTALLGLGLQADIVFAEPGAFIGATGTADRGLPHVAAEDWLAAGQIDDLVDRERQGEHFALTLDLLLHRGVAHTPASPEPAIPPSRPLDESPIARHWQRPIARDYLDRLAPQSLVLHGDRAGIDDPAVSIGFGRFQGVSAGFILAGGQAVSPGPASYRKASRLIRLAGQFELPIVVITGAIAASPDPAAPGELETAVAAYLGRIATVPTPVIAVLTGETAGLAGFVFAVGDRVIMQQHALIAAAGMESAATARECQRLGVVDTIAPEPGAGAHTDPEAAADAIRPVLAQALAETVSLGPRRLLDERARRLRALGFATDAGREAVRLELAQFQELQRRVRESFEDVRHRLESHQRSIPALPNFPSRANLPQIALPNTRRPRAALGELAGRVVSTGRAITNRDQPPDPPETPD